MREMIKSYFVEVGSGQDRRGFLKQHKIHCQKAILALRLQPLTGRYTAPHGVGLVVKI